MATVGPAHIDIVPWGNVKASSATWLRTQSSTHLMGGNGQVTGGLINNYATWDVPLVAGNWTVTLIYFKATSRGIITASIDGVDLSPTVDSYAAADTPNNVAQWTGVSVATSGVKEFKLRVDSKNPSAGFYHLSPHLITFSNEDDPTTSFTCTGPSRIDIVPFGFWEHTSGGGGSRTVDASSLNGGWLNTLSQNDEIGWYVPLTAGTWTLDTVYLTWTPGGIATWSIDGTTVGTIDMYSASTVRNVVNTITGITVASSKMALLKFAMATKNASASAYRMNVSAIALRKTA